MPNAMEALELYFDASEELPKPSGIERLKNDPNIAANMADGAYFLSVPYIFNASRSTRINITLDKGLLKMIDEEAARRKMTRSALLAQAAEREVLG